MEHLDFEKALLIVKNLVWIYHLGYLSGWIMLAKPRNIPNGWSFSHMIFFFYFSNFANKQAIQSWLKDVTPENIDLMSVNLLASHS